MPHYLHFFSVAKEPDGRTPTSAAEVVASLPTLGSKTGEIELESGESFLFIEAVSELTHQDAFPLLRGEWLGVDSTAEHSFGWLAEQDAADLSVEIEDVLYRAQVGRGKGGSMADTIRNVAVRHTLDPARLPHMLSELQRLLDASIEGGRDVATVYT